MYIYCVSAVYIFVTRTLLKWGWSCYLDKNRTYPVTTFDYIGPVASEEIYGSHSPYRLLIFR